MPDLLPAGGDPLTSFPRVESWRVDLLGRGDATLGRLEGVDGFTVQQSVAAAIGGGRLELNDRGQGIEWPTIRVQPWWQVRDPAGQVVEWPLGVYVCSTPREDWGATGRSWRVDLLDKLALLDRPKVRGTYSLPAGTVVTTAVRALIASTGETSVAITDSAEALSAGLVWDPGTSKLRIINDLLTAINYWTLRADGAGQFVAAPYQPPAARPLTRSFRAGPAAIHEPAFTRTQDLEVPNVVILTSPAVGGAPALVGVASNDDPASDLSTVRRGELAVTETVDATSQEVIEALAVRRLAELSQVSATQEITHAAVPIALNDVVDRSWPTGTARAAVRAWSLQSGVGSLMRSTLLEVT